MRVPCLSYTPALTSRSSLCGSVTPIPARPRPTCTLTSPSKNAHSHEPRPSRRSPAATGRPTACSRSSRACDYADLIGAVPHEKPTPQGSSSQDRGLVGIIPGSGLVEDHVDVEPVGDFTVDLVQERHEVGAGVAGADVGDHGAGGHVEGGEQVAGAVAL